MLRRPPFVLYLTKLKFSIVELIFRSVITLLKIWKSTLQTFVQWHDSSLNTLWCNDNKTNKLCLGPRTAAFTYPLKTGALVIKSFTNSFDKNLIKVQNFYEKIIIGYFFLKSFRREMRLTLVTHFYTFFFVVQKY